MAEEGSVEHENIIRRFKLLNDETKTFYIYLINYGKVMAEFTMNGKVSSVNSRLTRPNEVVGGSVQLKTNGNVIASPDLDGSYGSNGDAIFFFTTDGAYVEWVGEYIVCEFPIRLIRQLELSKDNR